MVEVPGFFMGRGVIFEKFEPPEAAPPQKHRAFIGGEGADRG